MCASSYLQQERDGNSGGKGQGREERGEKGRRGTGRERKERDGEGRGGKGREDGRGGTGRERDGSGGKGRDREERATEFGEEKLTAHIQISLIVVLVATIQLLIACRLYAIKSWTMGRPGNKAKFAQQ